MKELMPIISDDLDWAENKVRTPAQQEVSLGFMGQWFELDITDDHLLELNSMLNRWISAGRPTSKPARAKGKARTQARGYSNDAADRNRRIAEWAEARGLKVTRRAAGGFYFPVVTQRAWNAEHPEEPYGMGSDRAGHTPGAGDRVHQG